MKWWRNLAGFLLPVLAVVILLRTGSCRERTETKQDIEQKAAITQADTAKVETIKTLRKVRHATDATLADTTSPVLPKPVVKVIVDAERAACDTVRAADSARVATRDVRIKTLESRDRGWLFLYGEAGGAFRPEPPIHVRLEAEVGIAIPLDRSTYLQLGVTTDQEVKVGVQRRVRVF
jgi:hypothetical protein